MGKNRKKLERKLSKKLLSQSMTVTSSLGATLDVIEVHHLTKKLLEDKSILKLLNEINVS